MITKEYLQQELAKRIDGYKRGVETTTDNIIAEMKSILILVDALQDYEKKYNEALKRFRAFKEKYYIKYTNIGDAIYDKTGKMQKDFESIFPELRESEDEEIRQQLLWLCGQWEHNPEGRTIPADIDNIRKIRNWLEKQKEQKHYWKPTETDTALFNKAVTTNKALTPTERAQLDIIRSKFGYCRAVNCSRIMQEEQEPAEWSEEDEKHINIILRVLDIQQCWDGATGKKFNPYQDEINWLKSLRLRPSWKPSDEQMEGLKFFLEFHRSQRNAGTVNWREYDAIESLYEQLKKL